MAALWIVGAAGHTFMVRQNGGQKRKMLPYLAFLRRSPKITVLVPSGAASSNSLSLAPHDPCYRRQIGNGQIALLVDPMELIDIALFGVEIPELDQ
jgi:hypothetical protein